MNRVHSSTLIVQIRTEGVAISPERRRNEVIQKDYELTFTLFSCTEDEPAACFLDQSQKQCMYICHANKCVSLATPSVLI